MKKFLLMLLVLMLAFCLVACANNDADQPAGNEDGVQDGGQNNEQNDQNEGGLEDPNGGQDEGNDEGDGNNNVQNDPPSGGNGEGNSGSNDSNDSNSSSDTIAQTLRKDFLSKAGSAESALALAEALLGNSVIQFSGAAVPVEEGFLTGFDNAEITGFKEGAMFAPMIGTTPFVGYIFVLEDGADVDGFISDLKANANLRWNICTEAEEMVAEKSGNTVFFVMSPKAFEA